MAAAKTETPASKSFAGVPEANFIDDVDLYMREQGEQTTEAPVLQALEEQNRKYKFMEMNLVSKRKRLKSQLPEFESSLQIVRQLSERCKSGSESTLTHFLLSDQVYARAELPPSNTVYVWMGAGCMLEYPLSEADTVLSERLANAATELSRVEHDIDFLRDQLTTVQVNIARVYNWGVKRRQAAKAVQV